MASGDCKYNRVWRERRARLFNPPIDQFANFERAMRARHYRLGWTDFDNREHRAAVSADWQAWEAYYTARTGR